MQITIDSKAIDFTLEEEKNSYEIVKALSQWLNKSNMVISSVNIDGNDYNYDDLALQKINIEDISAINITTLTLKEFKYNQLLLIQDYFNSLLYCIENNNSSDIIALLGDYGRIKPFLESAIDRVYNSGSEGFIETITGGRDYSENSRGELLNFCKSIIFIAEDRKREIVSTSEEIKREKTFFENFLPDIGNISVLLQTGKDRMAMEKIINFIDFSKIFSRLLSYYNMDTGKIEPETINTYNRLLNEFGEALERGDSVLVGDLLEYELAPVIEQLFNLMTEIK